jgi:hypothetical protein
MPVRVLRNQEGLRFTFRDIPPMEFQDPFCEETIRRIRPQVEFTSFVPRQNLLHVADMYKNVSPAGMIFHVSRCGSSLLSQVLKQSASLVVYSEPPVLNDILLPPQEFTSEETVAALRIACGYLGHHAVGPFVIKLRSWNSLMANQLLTAFPCTPWVFIVRDPVEVGVSVLNKKPLWMRLYNGSINPFLEYLDGEAKLYDIHQYFAQIYAAFCGTISAQESNRGLLVQYPQLPAASWTSVSQHFHIQLSGRNVDVMQQRAMLYSKQPPNGRSVFQPDSVRKHEEATYDLQQAVAQYATPALARVIAMFESQEILA